MARVDLGAKTEERYSRFNGAPAAAIGIYQSPCANAVEVARHVRETLDQLKQRFPDDLAYAVFWDSTVTTIILNHVGGPIGIGPYKERKAETFAQWKAGIAEVAKSPNVVVKLGGLGMPMGMFDFYTREKPPASTGPPSS